VQDISDYIAQLRETGRCTDGSIGAVIEACEIEYERVVLRARLQYFTPDGPVTEPLRIDCHRTIDFMIRPAAPNLMEGTERLEVVSDSPELWLLNEPRCRLQVRPGPRENWGPGINGKSVVAMLREFLRTASPDNTDLTDIVRIEESLLGLPFLELWGPRAALLACVEKLRSLNLGSEVETTSASGQFIPGGDGEVYDPPMKLRELVIGQSAVIAENFWVTGD